MENAPKVEDASSGTSALSAGLGARYYKWWNRIGGAPNGYNWTPPINTLAARTKQVIGHVDVPPWPRTPLLGVQEWIGYTFGIEFPSSNAGAGFYLIADRTPWRQLTSPAALAAIGNHHLVELNYDHIRITSTTSSGTVWTYVYANADPIILPSLA